ncbi:hypothetical protein LTR84_001304 [Exophiala bonariae]|uniref:3-hydroxyisobutyrate dehydrogenase n=1 Tax=Exophiala bonariae TaxID=1690606 RepID=A0AAV9NCE5_9EURO|nr:hypothetical protein LTR84_001304 [Exophiala bonariae]
MNDTVGFIGLGAMGYEMAVNVRKKMARTSLLLINDVNREACDRFIQELNSFGPIKFLSSAREVAEEAGSILSIVPAADHVKKVYIDPVTGVIAARKNAARLMLECSTIDVEATKDVGQQLKKAGAGNYIDTPVSGGVPGATAGTLAFLIGTAKNDTDVEQETRMENLLRMMGSPKKFFYCGQLGAGLAAKICNNYLSGVILLASAEAMNIGIRQGIDRKLLYQVVHNSTGQSWMFDNVNPAPGTVDHAPSSRDYQGGFKAQMMVKDMTLGVDAGAATGVRTSTGSAALALYKEAVTDARCIDRDVSVVYRFLDGPE